MKDTTPASRTSDEVQLFCRLVKVDAAKREVWGVVTAQEPDKVNEVCDYDTTVPYYKALVDEMSKATDGANIFPLRAMHGLVAAGKGIAIEFRDEAKEIYMGFKVVDDAEWKKCDEGVYTGFSQGGSYVKKWQEGDYTFYTAKPGEVSLVDVPCLTRAHFDYVKADGTHELRKFAKAAEAPVAEKKDDMTIPAKAVKYLVTEGDKNFLPYTKADGTPSRKLMLKAWHQLFEIRGNKYEGPDKEKAIKLLKQAFAAKGWDNPEERCAVIEPILKATIEEWKKKQEELGKGMYGVRQFASIIDELKWLWLDLEYERQMEEDESPATDEVKEIFVGLLGAFMAYAQEEVEEYTAYAASFEPGGMSMSLEAADLTKAAKNKLAQHHKVSAAFHEKVSKAHAAQADHHMKCMKACMDDDAKDDAKKTTETESGAGPEETMSKANEPEVKEPVTPDTTEMVKSLTTSINEALTAGFAKLSTDLDAKIDAKLKAAKDEADAAAKAAADAAREEHVDPVVKSFLVARPGSETEVDTTDVDPEFADLCKMDLS